MDHISTTVTALFAFLLLAMILSLALEEKIHAKKSVIVGLFAAVTLFLAAAFGLVRLLKFEILGISFKIGLFFPWI